MSAPPLTLMERAKRARAVGANVSISGEEMVALCKVVEKAEQVVAAQERERVVRAEVLAAANETLARARAIARRGVANTLAAIAAIFFTALIILSLGVQ